MKKEYYWRTLWLTEGSAALAQEEDSPEKSAHCDIRVCSPGQGEDAPDCGDEEEETLEDCRLSCGEKLMCGMAALLEEYLLFLAAGIQTELTPPVTVLFIWITLAVISAEAVKLSVFQ